MSTTTSTSITEGDLDLHNPLSAAGLALVTEYLGVADGQRVLDVGCGAGFLLAEWSSRWRIEGTGVDHNPHFVDRAKRRSHAVNWVLSDARAYQPELSAFDVGVCIGATFALGGFDNTLAHHEGALVEGGRAAIGEMFTDPSTAPVTEVAAVKESRTLPELLTAARGAGMELVGLVEASLQDWDHYRSAAVQNFARWARANPEDPRLPVLSERVRRNFAAYVALGRPHYRWAVFVFERPA